MANIRPSTLHL